MSRLELKVPPAVAGLVVAALMGLAARLATSLDFAMPGRTALSLLLALAGIGAALAGVASFRRARTTVNPMRPDAAASLVRSGIYRFTRNPMYLGMALVLLAWGVWLANALSLALVASFVLYMNRFQIAPEERALAGLFGPDFEQYRRSVRRWI
jgi:protein-S-isoprenylcysteine O-methyltransferase Ste14